MLIATAAGLLCLATVLVAWLLWQSHRRYEEAAAEQAQNTARILEQFLSAHFQASQLALQSAADEFVHLHDSGAFSSERFSAYLVALKQRLPNALSVRGTDAAGNIIYGEGLQTSVPANIAATAHFRRLRATLQPLFGPSLHSQVSGEWLFPLMLPLTLRNGEFAGSVYVNTSTTRIEELFASIMLGPHGLIELFDAERNVIARYPLLDRNGRSARVAAPATLAQLEAGHASAVYPVQSPFDGYWRMAAYRRTEGFPAYVLVGLAAEDYLAPWRHECVVGIGFLLVLGVGSLLLGFSVRRYMGARLRVETLEERQSSHDHLTAIIRAIPDLLFEVDLDGRYLDCRATNTELLALPPDEFIGRNVSEVLPAAAAEAVLAAIAEANRNGYAYGTQIHIQVPAGELWFELSIARKQDHRSERPTFIVLSRDITERTQAQARIEQLAFSDMLTGLPNRRLFLDRLRQSMAVSERNQNFCALLFLDIDKFKTLNDTLGHHVGDILLTQVAERLRRAVRDYDTVARLGGDEFVVLLEQLGHEESEAAAQAQHVAEKVSAQLGREYDLDGHKYIGTGSIGIALFRGQDMSSDELLRRADLAMYQSKSSSGNALCFFDPKMQANIAARQELELDLKQAIIHAQFFLCFQPQFDADGALVGAEALIRWSCPKRGLVPPGEFIPLAEESGLILPIGHWVMREACACLERWRRLPALAQVALSVNVSAKQVALPTFAEEVSELLSFYDIDPALLKLEITESMLMVRVDETIAKINELRALGVNFSLDDFGTGYSSLSYLKRLPFDQIKIDQSFARGALDNANDAAICRAVVALGQALGLDVLAEGIETEAQWRFFKAEGCNYGQGYFFGRPMPLAEFEGRYAAADNAGAGYDALPDGDGA
ncbi:MAG TPA: EAL domain-containing protein [Rhodocyclaceae bacterium]|nr:EAL domain-containing protein [Rhodocyclaceae bacterium]